MDLKIFINLFILIYIKLNILAFPLPPPPIFEKIPHYPTKCYLPPGICLNNKHNDSNNITTNYNLLNKLEENKLLLHRFFFDFATKQCYEFSAQECGGNENRFLSIKECMEICKLNIKI
ncbi:BPTI/Kunitz inhibitor domain-containing protein [Meloidogyne graminicola]|uniref:BPTI/Kunitz inhibitor domain-containing protein n=1 Tax=Meloidogyne graminicola TaxID=189291 RepID=A0A8S9ZR31_9BILA|nr:BPTI/Kunitz inhibitor domain-containing protein [Meloidogyne graminicola]